MRGKQKCKILKEIRQKIADENEIPYITRECRFQGDCSGTCPRCESELRYLEQQLALRASMGKRVTVAALCAGMAFASAGCGVSAPEPVPVPDDLSGAVPYEEPKTDPDPQIFVETGEVAWTEDTGCDYAGSDAVKDLIPDASGTDALPPEEEPDPIPIDVDLTGDVAYFPEEAGNG